jgi:hypothetical protein
MGKGELLDSAPRNRPNRVWAETMPGREPWTYGNWSSDVTAFAKSATNRGRTGAAGVMSGACLVGQVLEMPQPGRVLQVGVPERGTCPWLAVMGRSSADGWCRAHIDHESSDVHFPALMKLSAGLP